ncbi:hypothetical protein AGMMS49975_28630 [Clostridia bacterium]|nr:hypothetical protein AGMMS49975_28630 [Clostridia bacterium]
MHYRHFCTVLGCEYAPYEKIDAYFSSFGKLVNPFPLLCRDTIERVNVIISDDRLLSNREYHIFVASVADLMRQFKSRPSASLYGSTRNNGYPFTKVMQAIAYVIADDGEVGPKRVLEPYKELIERHLTANPGLSVEICRPDLLTPLVIVGNGRGALVGADNPAVYEKLVSRDPNNQYKLLVRPITEDDLRNA